MDARFLVIPLKRPQYVVNAEVLISSLARRAYSNEYTKDFESSIGFTYRKNDGAKATVRVHEFFPRATNLVSFDASLQHHGMTLSIDETFSDEHLLGRATSLNVLGTRSRRGNSQPASPLTPALALMQDLPGLLNKSGPADIGAILETIFSLGAPAGYEGIGRAHV